eukprot:99675-Prymnesium_polylepis.1
MLEKKKQEASKWPRSTVMCGLRHPSELLVLQCALDGADGRPCDRDTRLGHHEDAFLARLDLLERREDLVARQHLAEDGVLVVQ